METEKPNLQNRYNLSSPWVCIVHQAVQRFALLTQRQAKSHRHWSKHFVSCLESRAGSGASVCGIGMQYWLAAPSADALNPACLPQAYIMLQAHPAFSSFSPSLPPAPQPSSVSTKSGHLLLSRQLACLGEGRNYASISRLSLLKQVPRAR